MKAVHVALVLVALVAVAVAGCSPTDPGAGPSLSRSAYATVPAAGSIGDQGSATSEEPGAVGCSSAIGGVDAPAADHRVVLQSVALAVAAAERTALQANPTRLPDGTAGFFAKDGLLVRAGQQATLTVPSAARGRLWLGWGGVAPAETVTVNACEGRWKWLAYAGGYTVREVGCYPVAVTVGSLQVEVSIPVGAPCPLPSTST